MIMLQLIISFLFLFNKTPASNLQFVALVGKYITYKTVN